MGRGFVAEFCVGERDKGFVSDESGHGDQHLGGPDCGAVRPEGLTLAAKCGSIDLSIAVYVTKVEGLAFVWDHQ